MYGRYTGLQTAVIFGGVSQYRQEQELRRGTDILVATPGRLLDLIDHLADTLDDTRVLIVCPTRPELLETRPEWGAGKRNAIALNLSPLGPADARRLVAELLAAG